MIYRPQRDHIQAIYNHFNITMENILCKLHGHYIMNIDVPNTLFDGHNQLTADGCSYYWRSFDEQLREFDEQRSPDLLKPTPQIKCQFIAQTHMGQCYRMPPPPSQRENDNTCHPYHKHHHTTFNHDTHT